MLCLVAALVLTGCPSKDDDAQGTGQTQDVPVDPMGTVAGTGGTSTDTGGAGTNGSTDAGGGSAADAGTGDPAPTADAGTSAPSSSSSCCEAHAEPGCVDADTQACVCGMLPECCTNTWDEPCVQLVKQKFCEPGVRECVCGPASEGGWEQTQCCAMSWSEFCASTAFIKCMGDATCM